MRIPKTSEVISISLGLTLALLISVGAAAQSTPPPVSSTQPDATAPAQSAPPAAQQPSSAPPSANSGGSAQSGSTSIDDELQLTPDQKQKIAAVVDDENKQISAVRDDNSMSIEQKQQKVLTIRQAGTPKIKAVLTPDQLQKLAAIQQRMRDQQNGQQGPAQNPNPPHQ